MSNKVITKPTRESGLYKKGYLHEDGGIEVTVDGVKKVEVEVMEYKICRNFWNNDKVYDFKQKNNLEILDTLFKENNCTFQTDIAKSKEFILCRLVVLDKKLYDRSGTCKEIINEMQSEKSCNVTEDAKEEYGQMRKGGIVSANEEAQIRLDVLKRIQRKKPTKEIAGKIRELSSLIRKGHFKKDGSFYELAPREKYVADLIATHNLNYSNLLFADKIGGISMPSLAIIKITNPLLGFGDVILVAPKSFIDPEKNLDAKVFSRDVYSPTYPKVFSHVDKYALNKLESSFYQKKRHWSIYADDAVNSDMSHFIEDLTNGKHLPDLLDSSVKNWFIVYLWATENNIEIEIPTERYNFRYWSYNTDTDSEFITSLQNNYPVLWNAVLKDVYDFSNEELLRQLSEAFKENYINYQVKKTDDDNLKEVLLDVLGDYLENGILKDNHDYSAFKNLVLAVTDKRRVDTDRFRDIIEKISNEHAHEIREYVRKMVEKVLWGSYFFKTKTSKAETTLDNIYDYMLNKSIKSSEKTMVHGLAKSASYSAKEYDSLIAVARDKDHYTVTEEEFEAYKERQDELWHNVTSKIRPYYKYENSFGFDALDELSKAMGQISQYKNPTDERISAILSKNGYGKTPSYLYDDAREFAELLRNSPAEYFEVKVKDVVKLESFIGAVVPKSQEEDVVPLLLKHGITNISFYDKSDYDNRKSYISEALEEVVKNATDVVLFKKGGETK